MPTYWRVERWGPCLETAREQIRVSGGAASRKPLGDSSAGFVRDLELHRLASLFLNHCGSTAHPATGTDVVDFESAGRYWPIRRPLFHGSWSRREAGCSINQHLRCRPRPLQRRIAIDRLGSPTSKNAIAFGGPREAQTFTFVAPCRLSRGRSIAPVGSFRRRPEERRRAVRPVQRAADDRAELRASSSAKLIRVSGTALQRKSISFCSIGRTILPSRPEPRRSVARRESQGWPLCGHRVAGAAWP